MENLTFKLILLIIALGITFSGCKEDNDKDDENINESNFTFEGVTYNTPNGCLLYDGDAEAGSVCYLLLYSSSVQYNPTSNLFSGTGDGVYIMLISSSATGLSSGTYIYIDRPDEMWQIGDAAETVVYTNYNFGTQSGNEYWNGMQGTGSVIVKRSGDTYEITYNTTIKGKNLKGQFKGSLVFDEYEEKILPNVSAN